MKFVNDLAESTLLLTGYFYKHLCVIFPYHNDKTSSVWLGTFAILTIGFANTKHTDRCDLVDSALTLFKNEFKKPEEDDSLLEMMGKEI